MKQWVTKLISQLDYDFGSVNDKTGEKGAAKGPGQGKIKLSEERATIVYMMDVYNKNLIEVEGQPVRRVREQLDEFTKELVSTDKPEDVLFRFRQFFSAYRVAEYGYMRKTFEDFKAIIWNFVEQLSEDAQHEESEDRSIHASLEALKEAVESDSMDTLRAKSKEFINVYVNQNAKKQNRRTKRMKSVKKNLDFVKRQLSEADRSMRTDHLTGAYNRRNFDEQMKNQASLFQLSKTPVSMIILDIDFFKKVNDTYGHDIGDFVLKECVGTLKSMFGREEDFVARIGGEEFAIILPAHTIDHAVVRAEETLAKIRKEVYIHGTQELRFTVSMGIAQLQEGETVDSWLKRADTALYESKHTGRNKLTLAKPTLSLNKVA